MRERQTSTEAGGYREKKTRRCEQSRIRVFDKGNIKKQKQALRVEDVEWRDIGHEGTAKEASWQLVVAVSLSQNTRLGLGFQGSNTTGAIVIV